MYATRFAQQTPDKPAIIMAGTGRVYSFKEYEECANQVAHLFRELGLQNGDTVALVLPARSVIVVDTADAAD